MQSDQSLRRIGRAGSVLSAERPRINGPPDSVSVGEEWIDYSGVAGGGAGGPKDDAS